MCLITISDKPLVAKTAIEVFKGLCGNYPTGLTTGKSVSTHYPQLLITSGLHCLGI